MTLHPPVRLVVLCALICGHAPLALAQVPPSIRASTVRGAPPRLSEAEQVQRCADLKALIAVLTPEANTATKRREVADYERMRGRLACSGAGVLRGRWGFVGTSSAGGPPVNWTVELVAATKEEGQALADEHWGGLSFTASLCGTSGTDFFYKGTVDFKKGDTFNGNDPFQWWPEGRGTVLVCVGSADSGSGWAYLRDRDKGRAFRLQLSGNGAALEGDLIPPSAPAMAPMRFKATR